MMGDRQKKFIRGHNALKKSGPKQISKAKEIEKKKNEEAETAAVLSEYIEAFQTGAAAGKTFVRADVVQVGDKVIKAENALQNNNGATKEHIEDISSPKLYKPKSRMQELAEEFKKSKEITEEYKSSKDKKKLGEKKKSNLELFKEELERSQKEREIRNKLKKGDLSGISEEMLNALPPTFFKQPKATDEEFSYQYDHSGSHDTGDPTTTNLFISNINPKMNEEQLCRVFGTYGPLASVKIMWPRTEEEKARNKNCGFVAFMNRKDGEKCLEDIEGKYVMDYEMKIGWGKAVPIPPQPIYVHPSQSQAVRPPKQSGLPFNCQLSYKARKTGLPFDGNLENTVVKVVIPTERNLLALINRLVEFVVREGPMFEAMIMNREINNPMYMFLFENKSNEHVYYRWRIFSLLQGDTTSTWSEGCFRLFKGGSIWQPPKMTNYGTNGMVSGLTASAAIASASSANVHNLNNALPVTNDEESPTLAMKKNYLLEHLLKENEDGENENKEKKSLSDRQRDRLEDMLRTVTTDRTKIGELMMWCIDHADYSQEIVECICESLSILETPIPTKIARLFVVNDILHNCSAKIPNVSNFRKNFQDNLLETMEHLHKALTTCSTKSQAEKFRKQVLSCLAAWQDWSLYPPHFLINLQNVFVGLATSKNIKEEEEIANKESLIAKLEAEKEIDGEPIIDDIDGIPIAKDDIDVDDIDGEALIDEDIDGVPLAKDNIDGIPLMDESVEQSRWEKDDPLSKSRWERKSDEETIPAKQDGKDSGKWQKVEGVLKEKISDDEKTEPLEKREKSPELEAPKHKKASSPPPEDEGRRKFLRDVEVKVMRFVDKLEQRGGSKSGLNIQKEAEKFRKQLIEEYDMVQAREHRRKVKSERKRGRSNSPGHSESKRQKNSKKRDISLSNSDSEPDIHKKVKSKISGLVSSSNSRSQSPRLSPRRSTRSFSGSPLPKRSASRSPIFRDRGSRSPRGSTSRRSMSFTPSPKRSVSPRRSASPELSPRYTKISRSPSPRLSPSSPKKLSSSVKSVKKKKAKKSRR